MNILRKYHLGIDAYCSKKVSPALLKRVSLELIKMMDMKALSKPIIGKGNKELPGYSSIILIETSHIALHHFSREKRIWADILSCKSFDKKSVIDYLKKVFELEDVRYF